MTKWYEVKVTSTTVFVVEVRDDESENDAMTYAIDEVSAGDKEAECSAELTGDRLDSAKRHADEVLDLTE